MSTARAKGPARNSPPPGGGGGGGTIEVRSRASRSAWRTSQTALCRAMRSSSLIVCGPLFNSATSKDAAHDVFERAKQVHVAALGVGHVFQPDAPELIVGDDVP
uniref:Uncharacterized protein n=1 Tax=Pyrodinium bahamense TaxID=73915 RepID=A0A7S0A8Q4_9DINO